MERLRAAWLAAGLLAGAIAAVVGSVLLVRVSRSAPLGTARLRSGGGHPLLWHLVLDAQGLTAVAAVLLLPVLCRRQQVPVVPAAAGAPSAFA
jgi:hypothetical protein